MLTGAPLTHLESPLLEESGIMPVRGTWADEMRWLLMAPSGACAARHYQQLPNASAHLQLCRACDGAAAAAACGHKTRHGSAGRVTCQSPINWLSRLSLPGS